VTEQYERLEKDGNQNIAQLVKEMRIRHKKNSKSEAKDTPHVIDETLPKNRRQKLVTLVAKGSCVIGAVFHVNSKDNTGEFDPFYIERIKNCLHLMTEKEFITQLD
jgi:hypothetical protein